MNGFDVAKWYRITPNNDSWSLETNAHVQMAVGSVYFQKPNLSSIRQRWQLYRSTNGSYVLRSGEGGPTMFLVTQWNTKFEGIVSDGSTVPQMMPAGQINDYSMFWYIKPWRDGTYWMENFQNGSDYHLEKQPDPGGLMRMSSNISGDQPGQTFIFKPMGKIADAKFSTLISPSHQPHPHSRRQRPLYALRQHPQLLRSGLQLQNLDSAIRWRPSTGSQAATGATVGAIICLSIIIIIIIIIIIGSVVYWRRRKAAHTRGTKTTIHAPLAEVDGQQATAELDVASLGLMKGITAELPSITPPAELDSSTIH